MNTAKDSDSEYCPDCNVKIMEDSCFCDWPENPDVMADKAKADRLLNNYDEKSVEFRDKIKSITFNKIKGGARR